MGREIKADSEILLIEMFVKTFVNTGTIKSIEMTGFKTSFKIYSNL